MVDAFPDADLLCLWNDVPDRYPGRDLRETWLAKTPLRRSKAGALPFIPATWRGRKPGGYDWALVSSHLFAHHVSFAEQSADFRKYVYVHSPARYIWNPELDGRGAGLIPRLASPSLRSLDRKRAGEAHAIAANSQFVRDRIRRVWDRDAEVIYPPVDVERIQSVERWAERLNDPERLVLEGLPKPFILGASRFVPYKRLDLVISAGVATGLPVVLAGSGPEEARLREQSRQAPVPVHFVPAPSDSMLYALYQAAMALVFPAIEDFGIMPVEAMAAGTPVVVGPAGGARETVVDGASGAVATEATGPALADALRRCEHVSSEECASRARAFDGLVFRHEIREWVLGSRGMGRIGD